MCRVGLGYLIQLSRIMLETERVIVGMLVIGLTGWGMNMLLSFIERRLLHWNREYSAALSEHVIT